MGSTKTWDRYVGSEIQDGPDYCEHHSDEEGSLCPTCCMVVCPDCSKSCNEKNCESKNWGQHE